LFSQDIEQAPYAPIRDPLKDGRTLFTFRNLPYSPIDLMRRWEDLRRTHHGFIQPLMQGLTKQMTPRARFLFLVQSLEGLHTETAGEGPIPLDEHRARRKALLRAVKDAGLPKTDLRWLDHWLDRYGRFTLEERLVQLCDAVREDIGNIVDLSCVQGDIPQVRNRLSHGAEDYQWPVLRPPIQAMSAIGVAHVLQLLDLPRNRLAQVFGQG
jgi:ApeA N-terminal domain 1